MKKAQLNVVHINILRIFWSIMQNLSIFICWLSFRKSLALDETRFLTQLKLECENNITVKKLHQSTGPRNLNYLLPLHLTIKIWPKVKLHLHCGLDVTFRTQAPQNLVYSGSIHAMKKSQLNVAHINILRFFVNK